MRSTAPRIKHIMALLACLEEGLGGTADDLFPQYTPDRATHLRSRKPALQLATSDCDTNHTPM